MRFGVLHIHYGRWKPFVIQEAYHIGNRAVKGVRSSRVVVSAPHMYGHLSPRAIIRVIGYILSSLL